jgi:hypothetical protein
MNIAAWVLQAVLAVLVVVNMLATPFGLRSGVARNPPRALLAASSSYVLGTLLILPWLVHRAPVLTPIAAVLLALLIAYDLTTNHARMAPFDFLYDTAMIAMCVAVAAIRF